ncbi:hypothetical protein QR680_011096 [Steinernema hermaphroditum]|uniref:Uncharacterized protein n=1 Tax=Steinernema hermaphroditum TaxID=289476 RepID=A0AA39MC93_9BILA|nr:hypothetical protein QR680_011096 [Steinernema hermaphroditum]
MTINRPSRSENTAQGKSKARIRANRHYMKRKGAWDFLQALRPVLEQNQVHIVLQMLSDFYQQENSQLHASQQGDSVNAAAEPQYTSPQLHEADNSPESSLYMPTYEVVNTYHHSS